MSTPSPQEIICAYRNLYRSLLHAVQYSKPARYIARNQLRRAFRQEHPSSFNRQRIDRTVEFLQFAAKETGLEHRLVKSLLHTAYWENHVPARRTDYYAEANQENCKDPLPDDLGNAQ